MKQKLSIILVFLYNGIAFAQKPEKYANFIQTDTAIKWAALYDSYVNLTPQTPNFNIRNFYINRLKAHTAAIYHHDSLLLAVSSADANFTDFTNTITKTGYNPAKVNFRFGFDKNKQEASESVFYMEENKCGNCPTVNTLSFFKVKQLLWYRNHRLFIKNILLMPLIYTKEKYNSPAETVFYETADFAFNNPVDDADSIPASAKFIGRTSNNLVLLPSFKNSTGILTLNNWNICAILRKDIKDKYLKAYDTRNSIYPDTKKILVPAKLDEYLNIPIEVPVYNESGEMIRTRKLFNEFNTDSLYNLNVVQDFYFDFDKEILYSKLIAVAPRIMIVTPQGIQLGLTDYWGIIFPEEKKSPLKKTK